MGHLHNIGINLISNHLSFLLPNLSTWIWNFNEAGHGKGAPNGMGTTLKQTADKVVGEGHDIETSRKINVCIEDEMHSHKNKRN